MTAYLVLNIVLLCTNVTLDYGTIANRAGWLATSNMCVVVFLALKHTPLALLSRTSYERLNPLHQLAGCLTIALVVIHGVAYTVRFMDMGRSEMLRRPKDIAGIVAGFTMAMMGFVPLLLKARYYEVFYATHIIFFIGTIVATAIHQPAMASKVAIMTTVAGAIWCGDRLLRLTRACFNFLSGNEATLYPLPDGSTRVILAKAPPHTKGGKHLFLWIPAASRGAFLQSHPFSIVSVSEDGKRNAELVVRARNGFTRRLHDLALKNPGIRIRAAADGAYGVVPSTSPKIYDKVVLVAGGSGASFSFGLVRDLLQRMEVEKNSVGKDKTTAKRMHIELIWVVRYVEDLAWFADSLRLLREHPQAPNVNATLHVTTMRGIVMEESGRESDEVPDAPGMEKAFEEITTFSPLNNRSQTADEEKHIGSSSVGSPGGSEIIHESGHRMHCGRPNLEDEIAKAISSVEPYQRVLVAACGPDGMMRIVRRAVARNVKANGPAVEFHAEAFGW